MKSDRSVFVQRAQRQNNIDVLSIVEAFSQELGGITPVLLYRQIVHY